MGLMNIIAKKLRRRRRKKGTRILDVSPNMTVAERLIMNNWNITFSNPEPERAGVLRQMKRDKAKFDANKKIPRGDKMTRQRMRATLRRQEKLMRQEGNAHA